MQKKRNMSLFEILNANNFLMRRKFEELKRRVTVQFLTNGWEGDEWEVGALDQGPLFPLWENRGSQEDVTADKC